MIQFDLRIFVQKGWFNHQEEVTSWFVIQVIEIQVIRKKTSWWNQKITSTFV